MGVKLIPWMLIGEVYPTNVRSTAAGISSGIGYVSGFLSNKLFLSMLAALTLSGTIWFYSAVTLIGCIVLYFILPETENRSLVDIEAHFAGIRSLKPKQSKSAQLPIDNSIHGNGQTKLSPTSELQQTKF